MHSFQPHDNTFVPTCTGHLQYCHWFATRASMWDMTLSYKCIIITQGRDLFQRAVIYMWLCIRLLGSCSDQFNLYMYIIWHIFPWTFCGILNEGYHLWILAPEKRRKNEILSSCKSYISNLKIAGKMSYFLFPVISLSTVLEHNIIIPSNK